MKYPRKMQGYRDRVQAAAARGDVQAREAMCLVLYLEEVNGGPKTREWQRRKLAAALLKQDLEADIPRRDGLWGDGRGKCHECRRKFTGEPRLMFQRVYALGGPGRCSTRLRAAVGAYLCKGKDHGDHQTVPGSAGRECGAPGARSTSRTPGSGCSPRSAVAQSSCRSSVHSESGIAVGTTGPSTSCCPSVQRHVRAEPTTPVVIGRRPGPLENLTNWRLRKDLRPYRSYADNARVERSVKISAGAVRRNRGLAPSTQSKLARPRNDNDSERDGRRAGLHRGHQQAERPRDLRPDDRGPHLRGFARNSRIRTREDDRWLERVFLMFPDYTIRVETIVGQGELVAVFGSASGTYNGKRGLVPENKFEMPAAWRGVVQNGKVKRWQVYADWTAGTRTIAEDEATG